MPWLPPSRPRPDSFVPPKGMAAWLTAPSLTPTCADVDRSAPGRVDGKVIHSDAAADTMPKSRRSATAQAWPSSPQT